MPTSCKCGRWVGPSDKVEACANGGRTRDQGGWAVAHHHCTCLAIEFPIAVRLAFETPIAVRLAIESPSLCVSCGLLCPRSTPLGLWKDSKTAWRAPPQGRNDAGCALAGYPAPPRGRPAAGHQPDSAHRPSYAQPPVPGAASTPLPPHQVVCTLVRCSLSCCPRETCALPSLHD